MLTIRLTGFLLLCMLLPLSAYTQADRESMAAADTWLDHRTSALDKYLDRAGGIQKRLLRRLKRREAKLARKLAAKDSALYRAYLFEKGHWLAAAAAYIGNRKTCAALSCSGSAGENRYAMCWRHRILLST